MQYQRSPFDMWTSKRSGLLMIHGPTLFGFMTPSDVMPWVAG